MEKTDWLKKAEIFASLDPDCFDIIAGYSGYYTFPDATSVFREGDRTDSLYIVVSGSVQILKKGSGEDSAIIAELVPGEIMGELEFFTDVSYNTSAHASGETVLLRIPEAGQSLKDVFQKHPGIAAIVLYNFLRVVSSRLRKANSLVRENSALVQELRRQVYGDKLTGLFNKTFLEETLPDLMKSRSEPVSLFLMKPDNFKFINDTFGHEAGDETLKIMAAALNRFIGEKGRVLRYMGNELGIIFSGYGRDEALAAAESVKRMFNTLDISSATKTDDVFLSMSIGIALFPDHAAVADDLIAKAHELPLAGRERGGNIILFPEDVRG